jgi:hypothetical protein
MKLRVLIAIILLSCASVQALEMTPFANASIVRSSGGEGQYLLGLGPMRNVNGDWQPENTARILGRWDRTVFELPRDGSSTLGYQHYANQLMQAQAKVLFACSGHTCGSSASWASDHFSARELYGLDQTQQYGVFQWTEQGQIRIAVVYAVTRGNNRNYLLVDNLVTENPVTQQPSLETIRELLVQNRPVFLTVSQDDDWQVNDTTLDILAELLLAVPRLALTVVVAETRQSTLASNAQVSQEAAQSIVTALIERGAEATRVEAVGVGSYLPVRGEPLSVWVIGEQR